MFFLKTITISIIATVTIIATNTWHKIEPHTQNLVVYQESQTGFALGTLGHTQMDIVSCKTILLSVVDTFFNKLKDQLFLFCNFRRGQWFTQ